MAADKEIKMKTLKGEAPPKAELLRVFYFMKKGNAWKLYKILEQKGFNYVEQQDISRKTAPEFCGVYIILDSLGDFAEIVYIGSTKSFKSRLTRSHSAFGKCLGFAVVHAKPWIEYMELEKALIKKYRPKFNIVHNHG